MVPGFVLMVPGFVPMVPGISYYNRTNDNKGNKLHYRAGRDELFSKNSKSFYGTGQQKILILTEQCSSLN